MNSRHNRLFFVETDLLSGTAGSETVDVTVQPNNGDPISVLPVAKGRLLAELPVPAKRACVFTGWLSEGQLAAPETVIDRPLSLTAQWALAETAFEKDPNAGIRAEGTSLRVFSYNTLLPTVGLKLPVPGRDLGLFHTVMDYKPDVIALQEFNDTWCDHFRTVFAGTDYRLISGDRSDINGKTVTNTLAYNEAVLTLLEYDSFPYAVSDSTVSRVLTWAVLETKDVSRRRFIATSTHWALTEAQRLEEAEELARWLQNTGAAYQIPIIAMGDYNARDNAPPYLQLMERGALRDAKYDSAARGLAALTHYSLKGNGYTDELANLHESIDHIFYTEGMQPLYYDTVLNKEILTTSDHNPIYADFRFAPVP